MSGFRRVDADQAGPGALGILVPPGQRTMIIVRPRSLSWDLLAARPLSVRQPMPAFLELHRDEAAAVGHKLARALEEGTGNGPGRVEAFPCSRGPGYWVQAEVGALVLLACCRRPGQPYQPLQFATQEEAGAAVQSTAAVLFPPPGTEQELYFNTRNFVR